MSRALPIAATIAVGALALSACGATSNAAPTGPKTEGGVTTITIGASPTPHAKILQFVEDNLAAKAGLKLDIKLYDDYVQPNVQLAEGSLDANYFQHVPYFDAQVQEKGYEFAHFAGVHIEPFGLYSKKVTAPNELKDGAQVGINNDPSNQGRALELLVKAGLITLKDGKNATNATLFDIASNPKHLTFKETDPAQLVRSLDDFDAAVINGNYAIEAGLSPAKDAILVESGQDNPYANIVAIRKDEENNAALKKLDGLLHSPEVKQYIEKTWNDGAVLPAF